MNLINLVNLVYEYFFPTKDPFIEYAYDMTVHKVFLVEKMLKMDINKTIDVVFLCRNYRNGLCGNRDTFLDACTIIDENKEARHLLIQRIEEIPKNGRWKDLVELYNEFDISTEFKEEILDYFDETLNNDLKTETPSMCAKWTPSQNKRHSQFTKDLAKYMKINMETMRKKYLTPLRKKLNITEIHITTRSYDKIDVNTVPQLALQKYKNILNKKIFSKWSSSLAGLCKYYLHFNEIDNDIEYLARDSFAAVENNCKHVMFSLQTTNPCGLALSIFGSSSYQTMLGTTFVNICTCFNDSLHDRVRRIIDYPVTYYDRESLYKILYSVLVKCYMNELIPPEKVVIISTKGPQSDYTCQLQNAKKVFLLYQIPFFPKVIWWNIQKFDNICIDEISDAFTYVCGNNDLLINSFLENGDVTQELYVNFLLKN